MAPVLRRLRSTDDSAALLVHYTSLTPMRAFSVFSTLGSYFINVFSIYVAFFRWGRENPGSGWDFGTVAFICAVIEFLFINQNILLIFINIIILLVTPRRSHVHFRVSWAHWLLIGGLLHGLSFNLLKLGYFFFRPTVVNRFLNGILFLFLQSASRLHPLFFLLIALIVQIFKVPMKFTTSAFYLVLGFASVYVKVSILATNVLQKPLDTWAFFDYLAFCQFVVNLSTIMEVNTGRIPFLQALYPTHGQFLSIVLQHLIARHGMLKGSAIYITLTEDDFARALTCLVPHWTDERIHEPQHAQPPHTLHDVAQRTIEDFRVLLGPEVEPGFFLHDVAVYFGSHSQALAIAFRSCNVTATGCLDLERWKSEFMSVHIPNIRPAEIELIIDTLYEGAVPAEVAFADFFSRLEAKRCRLTLASTTSEATPHRSVNAAVVPVDDEVPPATA